MAANLPKHPLCGPFAQHSGACGMRAGQTVRYAVDGRLCVMDEALQDGDALVTFLTGEHGIVKWNHLEPTEAANV